MSKRQLAVLWAAPVATVVALGSFYAAVGGAADSNWPMVTLFSLVVTGLGTTLVSITSRRLPGVQWLYGYWIGLAWWLSGVGVQANIHQTRPDREPPWLWVAVLVVTTVAVAVSYQLRSRQLRAPALSQRPVVWRGATGINQFALPLFPIGLIAVFGGLASPVSALLTFGLPIVAVTGASMKCTVTIFEDQLQVENWLGIVLFRVPLSDVETVGAFAPSSRWFGMFLGLAPGWEMLSGESVLRTSMWPRRILTLLLEHGGEVSIGVKHSFEAAQAVRALVYNPPAISTVPSPPPPTLPPPSSSPNMATSSLPPPAPSAVAPEWPNR